MFLVPFGIAIIFALALDQVFQRYVLTQETELSNTHKVKMLMEEYHPNEIPVFGASKARSSFIPDTLGKNVYNYAMEKCNFDVIFFLLKLELEKEKDAPIIIEFNHQSFIHRPQHTIDLSTFVPLAYDERVVDYLRENGRLDKYQLIPGIRYFGSYMNYLRDLNRTGTEKKIISRGGFFLDNYPGDELLTTFMNKRYAMVARRDTLEKKQKSRHTMTLTDKLELEQLQLALNFNEDKDRIHKFEAMVHEHPNRDFIIVYTPQHHSEIVGIENYDKIDSLFLHWNEDIPNLYAFNYSKMPLSDSCFKNSSHINLRGARIFSSQLKKDIGFLLEE